MMFSFSPKQFAGLAIMLVAVGGAVAAPQRDEVLASRFLYCANVSQYWYQYLSKNEPNNAGIAGYRNSTTFFRLAAALISDADYIARERGPAIQKVVEVLEKEKHDKVDLMGPESKGCLDTFQKLAMPILKRGSERAE